MAMVTCYIKNNIVRIFLLTALVLAWFIDYKAHSDFSLCLFRFITGKECYACGTLRGISAFLHFDFALAFGYNRLNIITIPVLCFVYLRAMKYNRI